MSKIARGWFFCAIAFAVLCFFSLPASAQESDSKSQPVIVQPGAPGQPSKILPPGTRGQLPPRSPKDVEFMQGMIMHHAQAVEMTLLIDSRTKNKELRLLGVRIKQSQSDEMSLMKRWLRMRGERIRPIMDEMEMSDEDIINMDHSGHMMPGMLTKEQMAAIKKARGAEFDRLFLKGMIQHHEGALVMVKELFDTAGGGQDAELFNFATEVENGQRVEIRIMQTLLSKSLEKKQK